MVDGIAETGFSRGLTQPVTSFPGSGLWLTLAAVAVADVTWLTLSQRLSLDPWSSLPILPVVTLLPLLATYCRTRDDLHLQRLSDPLAGTLFIALAFAALRVFNHLTMSQPFPWVDDTLAKLDASLGFNWLGYTEWVSRQPLIIDAFQLTYTQLTQVAVVVFVLLFIAAGVDRAKEFIRLVFWSALVTTVIGATVPVRGAMDRFASAKLQAVFGPNAGIYPLPYLDALRANAPHVLDLEHLPGLVSMPSFHTASALLIAYCCRNIRFLNVLSILYATVVIASTPIMGGHYFVDLIGGALLTIAVILIDRRISYPRRASPAGLPAVHAAPTIVPQGQNEIPDLQPSQRQHPGGAEHRHLEQLAVSKGSRS